MISAIISQKYLNLIRNIALLILIVAYTTIEANSNAQSSQYQMSNPQGFKINLRLAITKAEQSKGLSGLKPSLFQNNEGMLFIYNRIGDHQFWMPDTYFSLDIIFLDQNLTIVGIEQNVPFHPGHVEPPVIYRTKNYRSQFILETKSNVEFSKKLKVGDKLKWESTTSLSEIVLKTHH